jgi:hypothetical protein
VARKDNTTSNTDPAVDVASMSDSPTSDIGNDEIARRAYEIYEARGRTDGADLDDWFEAERQLRRLEPQSKV